MTEKQYPETGTSKEGHPVKTEERYIYYNEDRKRPYEVKLGKGADKLHRFYATMEEAIKARDEFIGGYGNAYASASGGIINVETTPLNVLVLGWYNNVKRPNITPNTRKRYDEAVYKAIIPLLGQYSLKSLNPGVVYAFCEKLREKGYPNGQKQGLAETTIHVILSVLRQFCAYVPFGLRYPLTNPCQGICFRNRGVKQKRKAVQYEDMRKLFAWMEKHLSYEKVMLYKFFFQTGCRRGEVCGLQWKFVDLDRGIITIQNTLCFDKDIHKWILKDTPKTYASQREIPLTDEMKQYLRQCYLRAVDKKDGFVFSNRLGRHYCPKKVTEDFKRATRAIGLDDTVTLHSTRHTFASMLLDNGASMDAVKELGGWLSMKVVYKYYQENLRSKGTLNKEALNSLKEADIKTKEA